MRLSDNARVDTTSPLDPLIIGLEGMDVRPGGLNRVVSEQMAARDVGGNPGLALVTGLGRGRRVRNVQEITSRAYPLARLCGMYRAVKSRAADFDVVISHFALTGMPAALATRGPLVSAFHGPWAAEAAAAGTSRPRIALARAIERFVYRRSDGFITDSSAFRDVLIRDYGVHPGAVDVVHLGVDLARFRIVDQQRARQSLGLPASHFVAVCVRRMVPRMGHEQLLRAWRDVARDDTTLVIVGDGPLRSELESLAAELGVSASVQFRGRVSEEELPTLYGAADVSVVPTLDLEGFGLITLESMACGTPVVASQQGGLLESLAGSKAHTFVTPGNVLELTNALETRRITPPSPVERVAARAHAEKFSWAAQVAGTDRASLLATTRPTRRPWRVVVVDHCARPSGGQIALERLISELGDLASIHIVVGEDGPMVDRWSQAGATVEVIALPPGLAELKRSDPTMSTARTAIATLSATAALAGRLRDLRPDLVHCNSTKACVYGGLAGRATGHPVVWHIRDRIDSAYLPESTARLMQRGATLLPRVVVANSHSTLATVRGPARAVVGYSPIPAQPQAISPGRPVMGIAGRIADWKGHAVVLCALALTLPTLPDLQLRVAGAPLFGEDHVLNSLKVLAADLGIEDHVEWLGHVEDLGEERRAWGLAIHASTIAEPFGMVVVEAMAAGLPVLASAGGGPAEVITDGVDGVLVPRGDALALSQTMIAVLSDRRFATSLGEAARRRAADFAPPAAARSILRAWDLSMTDKPIIDRPSAPSAI